MNNNLNCVPDYMNEDKPLYISQGSQYNDVDFNCYGTSVLERNETGSFYIPSSGKQVTVIIGCCTANCCIHSSVLFINLSYT